MTVATSDLSPRQGKTLRYVVSRAGDPVLPERCVVGMPWSDLPKTYLQARATLEALRSVSLVERVGSGYTATQLGERLIASANKNHIWRR